MLYPSAICYAVTKQSMAVKEKHNLHTEQKPKRCSSRAREISDLWSCIQLQEYGIEKSRRGWRKLRNHSGISANFLSKQQGNREQTLKRPRMQSWLEIKSNSWVPSSISSVFEVSIRAFQSDYSRGTQPERIPTCRPATTLWYISVSVNIWLIWQRLPLVLNVKRLGDNGPLRRTDEAFSCSQWGKSIQSVFVWIFFFDCLPLKLCTYT